MCGRYTMYSKADELMARYKTNLVGGFTIASKFNIAPGQFVPVITERGIERMRWGLVPQWATSMNTGYSMFNAMGETLTEKRSYKDLITTTRCLVPATGFYEWITNDKKQKLPVYFKFDNDAIFSLAGIYTERKDSEGEVLKSFTIITTMPNELVRPVHDRMPVIIHKVDERTWLNPKADLGAVLFMLQPYPEKEMMSYRVDTAVNSAANEGDQLILPIKDQ